MLSQARREMKREKEGAGREHRGGKMDSGMTAGLWPAPSTYLELVPGCPDGTALQEAPCVGQGDRVAKESWGLLSSDGRANRPPLGLCPEANVPLQGRKGSRGCIPDAPGETGIHLEWKQRTPLYSRVATDISWSSLGGLKGFKPPEAFGERSRDWSLGHTGDEGPQVAMRGRLGVVLEQRPQCAVSP